MTDETVSEADVLRALDLPPEAIALFLAHIDEFCIAHGGLKHYAELMALVHQYQAAMETR